MNAANPPDPGYRIRFVRVALAAIAIAVIGWLLYLNRGVEPMWPQGAGQTARQAATRCASEAGIVGNAPGQPTSEVQRRRMADCMDALARP